MTAELANARYGRMWHTIYTLEVKFQPGMPCMHEGCAATAVRRIDFNAWGSIAQADACEDHAARYDGKMVDEFPCKRRENTA